MLPVNYKPLILIVITAVGVFSNAFSTPKETLNKKEVVKWAVHKTSTLRITGKTNIAGFGCDIKGYYQTDTIFYSRKDNPNKIIPLKGALNIDVNDFDCHNRLLTNDLRKTLKADEHPTLVVRFVALQRMPTFIKNKDVVKGWVEVVLAGTSKTFEIAYQLEKKGSVVTLQGARDFCFSDFNLTPPKKLGGIVRVKDDFNVDFKLVLNQVE